jgi:2-dehydropantoate 2-reductase
VVSTSDCRDLTIVTDRRHKRETDQPTVLTDAGIMGCVSRDVMAQKHGKLIVNLGNIVEAALGHGGPADDIRQALRDEGRQVPKAAGVAFAEVGGSDPRRE